MRMRLYTKRLYLESQQESKVNQKENIRFIFLKMDTIEGSN